MERKNTQSITEIYGMIEGRTTLHSMSCTYIRNTKRNIIPVDRKTVDASGCLCGKCLKNQLRKWTEDVTGKKYSVVLNLEMHRRVSLEEALMLAEIEGEEKKETLQNTLGERFGSVFSQLLAAAN